MAKKNPFKEIETKEVVPEEIKEKVMRTIGSMDLLTEFAELFLVNFPQVLGSIFQSKKKK
jgi:hypothetical protein